MDTFWPMAIGANAGVHIQGYVNTICTVVMMICAVIILGATLRRSLAVLNGRVPALDVVEA